MGTSSGEKMTKEYFTKAGLEDGLPQKAIDLLWSGRPEIIDFIPENENTRNELRVTNAEMKESLIELVAKLELDEVATA